MLKNITTLGSLVILIIVPFSFVDAVPTISAPVVSHSVGETFIVPISISGAADLIAWQFNFAFNPSVLQATSVSEGPFMSSFGSTLFSPGVVDNGAGLISLMADLYVDLPPDPSGSGVLANIGFTAIAQGMSPLTLSNVFLNLADQGFTVTNGLVRVPEPTPIVLIALAVVIFRARVIRVKNRKEGSEILCVRHI